jgi:hypothetical protein
MMINKEHETFQFTQLNNNINRLAPRFIIQFRI